jgi:hypothetical protein
MLRFLFFFFFYYKRVDSGTIHILHGQPTL